MVLWLDDGRMDAGIESHGYGGSAAAANDDDRSLSVNA